MSIDTNKPKKERNKIVDSRLKNIIIVNDSADINGGAANVAIRSAIALKKAGYPVWFFGATEPVHAGMTEAGIQVKCLFMNDINHGSRLEAMIKGLWNKKAEKEFSTFLSAFSPEETIIHVHCWCKALSSSVIKTSQNRGFNIVLTLHDYFSVCPNGGFFNYQKQEICHEEPMTWSCIRCNCDKRSYAQKLWRVARQSIQDRYIKDNPDMYYISISDKNESNIRPFVKSNHFTRISNPVYLPDKTKEKKSSSNRFLYVGRLSEEKGPELFCRAVTELKKEEDVEGIVLGDGDLLEELKRDYPEINFLGWMPGEEVMNYMLEATALVLPSICYEGAPLSVIEAMSVGLPCIVSDCTSATEIVRDEKNGFVFRSNDVESLVKSMRKALDPITMNRIGNEIQNTFRAEVYSEKNHTENLIRLYSSVLNQ